MDNPYYGRGGPRHLWEAGEGITWALAEIYESSIDTGEVLDVCRVSNVVALFKNEAKKNLATILQ